MYSVLLTLFILISLLMTVAILMQSSKGGGLAASFGGMGAGGVFGPRGAANFLQKTTSVLATLYLLLCLVIGLVGRSTSGSSQSVIQREMQQQQQEVPASTLPVAPVESDQAVPPENQNQP
jgi:preprotein translocase subunit SecG